MIVNIEGNRYTIDWLHYTTTIPEGSRRQAKKAHRQTVCDIGFPNGEVFTGVSVCGRKDNFCREIGRKISLTRALKEAGFTYEGRQQVWKAYFNRKKKKVVIPQGELLVVTGNTPLNKSYYYNDVRRDGNDL